MSEGQSVGHAETIIEIAQAIGEESTRLYPSMYQMRGLSVQLMAVARQMKAEEATHAE